MAFEICWVTLLLAFAAITSHAFVVNNTPRPTGSRQQQRRSRRPMTDAHRHASKSDIRNRSSNNNAMLSSSSSSILFELPIFPLRKVPRLPTDRLTLNLYEERYLELAEYILHQTTTTSSSQPFQDNKLGIFGALYTTHLPQVVPQGTGPIVPVLSVGDIGTLFVVHKETVQDERVPFDRKDPSLLRRRMKLLGLGVCRFEICKILSDGTAPVSSSPTKDYPFLLVQAKVVLDDANVIEKNQLYANDSSYSKLIVSAKRQLDGQEEDSMANVLKVLLFPDKDDNSSSSVQLARRIRTLLSQLAERDSADIEHQFRNELLSFWMVSTLLNGTEEENEPSLSSTQRRRSFLSDASTLDRLEWVLEQDASTGQRLLKQFFSIFQQ